MLGFFSWQPEQGGPRVGAVSVPGAGPRAVGEPLEPSAWGLLEVLNLVRAGGVPELSLPGLTSGLERGSLKAGRGEEDPPVANSIRGGQGARNPPKGPKPGASG